MHDNDEIKKTDEFADDEINLLDYLIVVLKRKKMILGVTLAFAVITAVISLIMPKIYRAEARILPPEQNSSMTSQLISQFAGGLSGIAGGIIGAGTSSDLYAGMLRSRTIKDRIIERFDLMNLYDVEYPEDARKELDGNTDIVSDKKSNFIVVSVEDHEPKRAADMANAFIEELKNLAKGLAISEAAQRRLFFEEQLKDAKEALIKAEDAMQGFQERTGALKMEDQAKAVIEGIADLRARIALTEVEIRVMKSFSTENNPDLQKAEEALKGMKAELKKLEEKGAGSGHDTLMPTGKMPEVGTEYIRKLRELKYHETLYELLAKQYEIAKIDEAKDAVLIQVIDKAIPPKKRARPKRTLMVITATLTGFFLAVLAAFFKEVWERAYGDQGTRGRMEEIKGLLRLK